MSLALSLGVIQIGVLVGAVLYGTVLVQTYIYASTFSSDDSWIKALVAYVCAVETLHTMCQWAYLYNRTVTEFGNAIGLNSSPWYFDSLIPLQALVGAAVQIFFAYRVQRLSGKWWPVLPMYIMQALRLALDVAILALSLKTGDLSLFQTKYGYMPDVALVVSAVTDVLTTALLCTYLHSLKSAYSGTKNTVHAVMLWSIETGIITSACGVLIAVCWATMPGNAVWVGFNMIYPKLYSNSLLVSLNSRAALSDETVGVVITDTNDARSLRLTCNINTQDDGTTSPTTGDSILLECRAEESNSASQICD